MWAEQAADPRARRTEAPGLVSRRPRLGNRLRPETDQPPDETAPEQHERQEPGAEAHNESRYVAEPLDGGPRDQTGSGGGGRCSRERALFPLRTAEGALGVGDDPACRRRLRGHVRNSRADRAVLGDENDVE